jgi:hypothetical protein
MSTPSFPRTKTLIARSLMRLLMGKQFTHRDFQNETASYRLSSCIEILRNHYDWPVETKMETGMTSDPVPRLATYGRYFIEPEVLKKLRAELGEELNRFIELVQANEARGV